MKLPLLIDADFIDRITKFPELVQVLNRAFATNKTIVPQRHHHNFPNPGKENENTLLLMPAYNPGEDMGVKSVTINPDNGELGLPAIQGSYLYMDASNGQLKAIIEAKSLTAKRTAATSALASKYLSRPDSYSLLMLGTGMLSTNLIRAHASVRPIKKVYVWGRNIDKAHNISRQLAKENFSVEAVKKISSVIDSVDIVSCATLSKEPLIFGHDLRVGQHLVLGGAYRPDMRESDDGTIKRATVFLDSYSGGLKESGDIAIPLEKGILKEEDIVANLFSLCSNQGRGRSHNDQITLFKSVGHALEDLTAAKYYYQKYTHDHV